MARSLERADLPGWLMRDDPRLLVPSAPGGHYGQEAWHISYEEAMIEFIETGIGLTKEQVYEKIHEYYQSGEARERIPDVDLSDLFGSAGK